MDGTNISVLCESRSGDLWIGTYGRGLMRFRQGRFVTLSAPVSLPHNNVLSVFEDAEENVWVGTQGGMLRLQPGAANTITTTDGAPLSISTIYQDPRGPVLVTALNGRLFQVARQTLVPVDLPASPGRARHPQCLPRQQGSALDRHGRSGRRAHRRQHESARFTMKEGLVNDFVRAFCEDREGGIWIGTDGGLSYWRDGTFRSFTAATA